MKIRMLAAIGCLAVLAAIAGLFAAKRGRLHPVTTDHAHPSVSTPGSSIPDEIGNGLTGHGAKPGGLPTVHVTP
jgi:hypothetical protein